MNPNEHLMDLPIGRASEHARSLYQAGVDAYALAPTPPPELGANVVIHPSPPPSYPNNVVQFSRVHHALQVRVFVNQRVVWNIDSRSCPFAPLAFLSTLDLLGNTNAMMIPTFNLFHGRGRGRWMRGSSSIGPIYTTPRLIFSLFERTPSADLINFRKPELGVECPGPLLFDLYIKVRASVFGKEEWLINQALAVEHLLDFEYN